MAAIFRTHRDEVRRIEDSFDYDGDLCVFGMFFSRDEVGRIRDHLTAALGDAPAELKAGDRAIVIGNDARNPATPHHYAIGDVVAVRGPAASWYDGTVRCERVSDGKLQTVLASDLRKATDAPAAPATLAVGSKARVTGGYGGLHEYHTGTVVLLVSGPDSDGDYKAEPPHRPGHWSYVKGTDLEPIADEAPATPTVDPLAEVEKAAREVADKIRDGAMASNGRDFRAFADALAALRGGR